MFIVENTKLDFNDVLIVPKRSTISSRSEVSLERTFKFVNTPGFTWTGIPIISANMASITSPKMAVRLGELNLMGCLHKHINYKDKQHLVDKKAKNIILSVGIKAVPDHYDLEGDVIYLENHGVPVNFICIDVANGYSQKFVDTVTKTKNMFPDKIIMAGNVVTPEMVEALILAGADVVKVGIGCLGAGTRILMADGSYKNIEDIKLHDWVINKYGKPVEVIGTQFSGYKKVKKYKNNHFYKESFVTPCHRHWVGDVSTSKNFGQSTRLVRMLDQKTRLGESKYMWKSLEHYFGECVLLMPKNIKFNLSDTFTIKMKEFALSDRGFNGLFMLREEITPSYNLGYIFGTFLGDGTSRITQTKRNDKINNKETKNTTSNLNWVFGCNEEGVANKLVSCIFEVFGYKCKLENKSNTILVSCRSNPLSRLFSEFGKRQNKHLPKKYWCSNKEYIKGILDGLIDSDGSYCSDGRVAFNNTSVELIELFMFVFYMVNGYYPSLQSKKLTAGNLKNCNINNCKVSYTARSVLHPEWLQTHEYQINRINTLEDYEILIPTYDIQVDCDTHSFIANNAIVHNSGAGCLTRVVTGVGYPQLSAVIECSDAAHGLKGHIISDGGCVTPGDVCKAFAAGADFVMLGGMLAGHDECGGEVTTYADGRQYMEFYGMSSKKANDRFAGGLQEYRASEGRELWVPYRGPVENTVKEILGGLRSCCTYTGSKTLKELPKRTTFIKVNRQVNESLARFEEK